MNQGKFVYSQFTDFLPQRVFDRLVHKSNGNENRDCRIFEEYAFHLIDLARKSSNVYFGGPSSLQQKVESNYIQCMILKPPSLVLSMYLLLQCMI
jgi:hypothetical protein